MINIFDAHVHIGEYGSLEIAGNMATPFKGREIKDYRDADKFMKKNHVTKAIFMPHYMQDQTKSYSYNYLVIDAVKRLNGAFGALYLSPEGKYTNLTEEHLNLIQDKIVALKMSPDAWPSGLNPDPQTWPASFKTNMEQIIETARRKKLMIHFHTGSGNSDISNYIRFVQEYGENLRIQFVHMGGSAGGHFKFVPLFIKWLKEGYNFYCDTSFCKGFGPNWLIRELKDNYPEGLNNVFFASDEPWGVFPSEYWRVNGMITTPEIKKRVFYDNAEKAYFKL